MILSAAAVALLSAQCAPPVTWDLIPKIAWTESKYDTWAIHDNTIEKSYNPSNEEEAVTLSANLMIKGHSLDLGIMQINTANLSSLGLTVSTAFDACKSINAASKILQFVSAYNTGSPTAGIKNGYASRVLAALHERPSSANSPQAQPAAPRRGPISPKEPGAKPAISDDSTAPDTTLGYATFPDEEPHR